MTPKPRPLTDAERSEARSLGMKGRLGRMSDADIARAEALYRLDPEGYGEAQKAGRADADATVTPFSR